MGKPKKKIRKSIRIGGQLLQKSFANSDNADLWYAEQIKLKERIEAGLDEPIKPNSVTVEEYGKIFMRRRANDQSGIVKGTYRNDGQRLKDYIFPLAGKMVMSAAKTKFWSDALDLIQKQPRQVVAVRLKSCMSDGEREELKKKVNRHKSELSNTTRNLIRAMLHTMYEAAIADKVVFTNPIAAIPVLDQGDPEDQVDFWETENECHRYLTAHLARAHRVKNFSWYCWAVWSLNGGPRVHELLALRHEDVDILNTRVRIRRIYDPNVKEVVDRTKGSRASAKRGRKRSSRWLYLNAPMMEAYRLLRESTPHNGPLNWIFLNTRSAENRQGNKLGLTGITKVHREVCEMADVRVIRIHDLRHTFASHFLMKGGQLKTLADILGHSHAWVTERYGHLTESFLAEETKRVQLGIENGTNIIEINKAINSARDA